MKGVKRWVLQRKLGEVWVRITVYGVLGVVTAVVAAAIAPMIPSLEREVVSREAVISVLEILTSSMLAVTTFSVSIMITGMFSAAGGATPRATRLLRQDTTSQQVLATFVGAFVYSLVSIIGLHLSAYGAAGRLVLLIVTVGVLATVIIQLVRWISHLGSFGLMDDTIRRIETAAIEALEARLADPFMGGRPLTSDFAEVLDRGQPILSEAVGYVQMVDMARLNVLAEGEGMTLAVTALPGAFVHKGQQLGVVLSPGQAGAAVCAEICAAFGIGAMRTFEQDPRFGVLALTEIASRALSPAVNDPGTAIDVLGRHLRILSLWAQTEAPALRFRSVMVQELDLEDLMRDAFGAIGRDGAGLVEVQLRLQKMLIGLVRQAPAVFGPAAQVVSRRALEQARMGLGLAADLEAVAALAADLEALVSGRDKAVSGTGDAEPASV